jgi:hypothetical protein
VYGRKGDMKTLWARRGNLNPDPLNQTRRARPRRKAGRARDLACVDR